MSLPDLANFEARVLFVPPLRSFLRPFYERQHMSSSRKRKQAALPSDLPPAASKGGESTKQELSEPTGTKHVPCHSGALGPDGKLLRFKDAPAHFRPGLTPRQMLLAGMHGGIYFNPKGGSAQPQPLAATPHSAPPYPSPALADPRRPSPASVVGRAWRQVPALQVSEGYPRRHHQRVPARVAQGSARGALPQPPLLYCTQQAPGQVWARPGGTRGCNRVCTGCHPVLHRLEVRQAPSAET